MGHRANQTNGPKDYDAVHKVQDGFKITPLADWGGTPKPISVTIDPSVEMKRPPLEQVNAMSSRVCLHLRSESDDS